VTLGWEVGQQRPGAVFPALFSVMSRPELESSRGGSIYTTEIGEPYQLGLFLFPESQLLTAYE